MNRTRKAFGVFWSMHQNFEWRRMHCMGMQAGHWPVKFCHFPGVLQQKRCCAAHIWLSFLSTIQCAKNLETDIRMHREQGEWLWDTCVCSLSCLYFLWRQESRSKGSRNFKYVCQLSSVQRGKSKMKEKSFQASSSQGTPWDGVWPQRDWEIHAFMHL